MFELIRILKGGSRGVRRVRKSYHPFSEPPYRGRYPFKGAPRGTLATSNAAPLGASLFALHALRARPTSTLSLYEDRRLWHPLGKAQAFPVSKKSKAPRIVDTFSLPDETESDRFKRIKVPRTIPWEKMARESIRLAPATNRWTWENPYEMIICLKRKMRREVLNAMGLAGQTGFKKPKYNQFSHVKCFDYSRKEAAGYGR